MIVDELINVLTDLRDKRGAGKMKVTFSSDCGEPYSEPIMAIRITEHQEKFLDICGDDFSKFIDFDYDDAQSGEQVWPK